MLVYLDTGKCINADDSTEDIPDDIMDLAISLRTRLTMGVSILSTENGWVIIPNTRVECVLIPYDNI